jgi:hypothetical protein
MTPRGSTPILAQTRRIGPRLALLFLPGLVSAPVAAPPARTLFDSHVAVGKVAYVSRPYLGAIGAPPLTFQSPPIVDMETRPLGTASSRQPAHPDIVPASASAAAPARNAAAQPAAMPAERKPAEVLPHPSKDTTPIMSDDSQRNVHPEDFLPFFQFPGSAGAPGDLNSSTAPSPAAPAHNLPSTATYRAQ